MIIGRALALLLTSLVFSQHILVTEAAQGVQPADRWVYSIAREADGDILIGTSAGIYHWPKNGVGWEYVGLSHFAISHVFAFPDGSLHVEGWDRGCVVERHPLQSLDDGTSWQERPGTYPDAYFLGPKQSVWCVDSGVLIRWVSTTRSWEHFEIPGLDGRIRAGAMTSDGNLVLIEYEIERKSTVFRVDPESRLWDVVLEGPMMLFGIVAGEHRQLIAFGRTLPEEDNLVFVSSDSGATWQEKACSVADETNNCGSIYPIDGAAVLANGRIAVFGNECLRCDGRLVVADGAYSPWITTLRFSGRARDLKLFADHSLWLAADTVLMQSNDGAMSWIDRNRGFVQSNVTNHVD